MIHKAEPAPQFGEDAESTCVHCHKAIKRVPGGHGPTWVHLDTGAVAGSGEPAFLNIIEVAGFDPDFGR